MFLYELSPITQRSASTRFDLPQPFGPDDAGQARLDQEVGRLDEGLEADDAQAGELHARRIRRAARSRRRVRRRGSA